MEKKKKKTSRSFENGGNSIITSDMLVEIMEECIRVFWRFVKADKESSGVVGKGQKRVHPEVLNAEDIGLLREVTKSLHKVCIARENLQILINISLFCIGRHRV